MKSQTGVKLSPISTIHAMLSAGGRAMDIREAAAGDIDGLLELENHCFDIDRLSRRSFRRFINRKRATLLVAVEDGKLLGYVLVLYRAGTSLARLYSMAVTLDARGRGIGSVLLAAGEKAAMDKDCVAMRLEVREDNRSAIGIYETAGYRHFGRYPDYYEDHADALRFEKALFHDRQPPRSRVPWHGQTLEFTCGPAALMMGMAALDPQQPLDRSQEIRLWRESTTVFMTSGHGGCGPFGLAAAAAHRGFATEIWVSGQDTLFVATVRNEAKKEVIRLVEADFRAELEDLGVPIHRGWPGVDGLREAFDGGAIPVVLISSWRIWAEKAPHWVTVTGFDDRFVFVNDPGNPYDAKWRTGDRDRLDGIDMPIPRAEFERMARYGRSEQRAVVLISREARG
jgi:ribosomal protein S18 acetylase RimI-like enzyme